MSDSLLFAPGTAATADAVGDTAFAQAMLDVESAWVRAQADLGVAPAAAADAVAAAAVVGSLDLTALAAEAEGGANALIPLLTQLRRAVGAVDADAVRWVHRGLTSQDVIDTALVLLLRRAAASTLADAEAVAGNLRDLATTHRDTPMVGRTLAQHAVPYTFGLKAATWLQGVDVALDALHERVARLPVQCGGASGTLAAVGTLVEGTGVAPLDLVERFAGRLGLPAAAPWHTARLRLVEAAGAFTLLADALGKIATDVVLLGRPEIAELAEPAAPGRGGSSAMPQKRNPVLSVLIRRTALTVPHLMAQLHLAAALADDERPDGAWHTEWPALTTLLRLVPAAAASAAELTGGLVVHEDRMLATLRDAAPAVLSERITAVAAPLLAGVPGGTAGSGPSSPKDRLTAMLATAGSGEAGTARLRADLRAAVPAASLDDAGLDDLLDPTRYLGAAGELVDGVVAASAAAAQHRDTRTQ
ncbi:3-carboxy-cis,cis-muconate cycloisomerase [Tersicoccus solisilvae]|uniref:3-carboxy-cis,cis-muconate cycloisomerase n=1 Tax=Tersicoccus solisilvae TaxID=1882339 RepID=A0ABQ1NZS8_9MICC|nr:lyase family protein [Tersicoccus solisilvae]GGC86238.1 3-carboxy-cis,cis-muconate cycloisomerase [Tersicoccus solisilvae]